MHEPPMPILADWTPPPLVTFMRARAKELPKTPEGKALRKVIKNLAMWIGPRSPRNDFSVGCRFLSEVTLTQLATAYRDHPDYQEDWNAPRSR